MHHLPRYERYPDIALLLSAGADTDAEDLEITEALWARTARNLKSSARVHRGRRPLAEEVADELAAVA